MESDPSWHWAPCPAKRHGSGPPQSARDLMMSVVRARSGCRAWSSPHSPPLNLYHTYRVCLSVDEPPSGRAQVTPCATTSTCICLRSDAGTMSRFLRPIGWQHRVHIFAQEAAGSGAEGTPQNALVISSVGMRRTCSLRVDAGTGFRFLRAIERQHDVDVSVHKMFHGLWRSSRRAAQAKFVQGVKHACHRADGKTGLVFASSREATSRTCSCTSCCPVMERGPFSTSGVHILCKRASSIRCLRMDAGAVSRF
jgi:hypothetical protein